MISQNVWCFQMQVATGGIQSVPFERWSYTTSEEIMRFIVLISKRFSSPLSLEEGCENGTTSGRSFEEYRSLNMIVVQANACLKASVMMWSEAELAVTAARKPGKVGVEAFRVGVGRREPARQWVSRREP